MYWDSLKPEEKERTMNELNEMIRTKIKEHGGKMTRRQALLEFLNIDVPRGRQLAIEEAIQNGRLDIAKDLDKRWFGINTFEIELRDEDTGELIP
jgi:hypothetical protein